MGYCEKMGRSSGARSRTTPKDSPPSILLFWLVVVPLLLSAFSSQVRATARIRRKKPRLLWNQVLIAQDLLASFFILASTGLRRVERGIQGFSSFLGFKQSLHCPVDLSVHSLFIAEDSVHITSRREGVEIKACIRAVSFNAAETGVIRFQELLPIRDARQEKVMVKLRFNAPVVLLSLGRFMLFFFYKRRHL
jgi:hypothetical protein